MTTGDDACDLQFALDWAEFLRGEYRKLDIKIGLADFVVEMAGVGNEAISAILSDPANDWTDFVRAPRPLTVAEVKNIIATHEYWSPLNDCVEPDVAHSYYLTLSRLLDLADQGARGRAALMEMRGRLLEQHPYAWDGHYAAVIGEHYGRRNRVLAFLHCAARRTSKVDPTKPAVVEKVAVVADPANDDPQHPQHPTGKRRFAREFHDVFDSPQHCALSCEAQAVIAFGRRRFDGRNNGAIFITLNALRKYGYTAFSKHTLPPALDEACAAGFLVVTRERRGGKTALYGLTWEPLPGETKARNTWATIPPRARTSTRKAKPEPIHAELAVAV